MECSFLIKSMVYAYLSIRDEYSNLSFEEIHPSMHQLASRFLDLDKLEKNATHFIESNHKMERKNLYNYIFSDQDKNKKLISLLLPNNKEVLSELVSISNEKCGLTGLCICPCLYDQKNFSTLSLTQAEKDFTYLEFCKVYSNLRLFNIYPRGMENSNFIKEEITKNGTIIDELHFELNVNQFLNLTWLYYINNPIYDNTKNPRKVDFWRYKVRKILGVNSVSQTNPDKLFPLTIIVYRPDDTSQIRSMKSYIREKCGKGFDVLHMNDNKMETIQMARTLFHEKTLNEYKNPLYQMKNEDIKIFFKFYKFYNKLTPITQDKIVLDFNSIDSDNSRMEMYSLIEPFDLNIEEKMLCPSNTDKFPWRIRHISDISDEKYENYENARSFYFFGVKCFSIVPAA